MRKIALIILLAATIICSARTPSQEFSDRQIQNKRIVNLYLANNTLLAALGELAVHQRIAIGFAMSTNDKNEARVNLQIDNASLEQVLNEIFRQVPAYKWQIENGVVSVSPKDLDDDFLAVFLGTHVAQFSVSKDATKFDIRDAVLNLKEVKLLFSNSGIKVSKFDYIVYPSIYSNDVDLSLSNTNVRTILNKVVNDSEHKMWVLQLKGEKRDQLELSF